jgi:broad specificity phosphatase PhoE
VPLRASTLTVAIALLFASFAGAAEPAGGPTACTTIIVVRHAEQTDPEAVDPPLSEAGAARARALAAALANSGVQAIYVTQYKRTKDTAAPTAALLHLPVIEVPVDRLKLADYAPQLARRLLSEHPSGVVLVVGHSNTVPAIVDALAKVKIRAIERSEFDRFIVVNAGEKACAHVFEAQYGHAP